MSFSNPKKNKIQVKFVINSNGYINPYYWVYDPPLRFVEIMGVWNPLKKKHLIVNSSKTLQKLQCDEVIPVNVTPRVSGTQP